MTWDKWVAIITLALTVISLVWNIVNSLVQHKRNLELEKFKSYYVLRQEKYRLEFKAYEELAQMVSELAGRTGAFILFFVNTDLNGEKRQELLAKWEETANYSSDLVNKLLGYSAFTDLDLSKKIYSIRDLCSKALKLFLELDRATASSNEKIKNEALDIKRALVVAQGEFNDELRNLLRIRLALSKE